MPVELTWDDQDADGIRLPLWAPGLTARPRPRQVLVDDRTAPTATTGERSLGADPCLGADPVG